jgi:hypothetical protein
MQRRRFVATALGLLPIGALRLRADDQGNGKGKGKGKEKNKGDDDHKTRYFREQDYGPVERYYGGPRDLPPGLRKKYYRTGTLPPGWEKRFQPFPPELVRQLPPLPPNCERGYIDGTAIVYDRTTRVILDSIDIIGALTRH